MMAEAHAITAEMARYYDARASQYDASMQYDNAEVVSRHMELVQQLKHWFADRAVLEIACGPGFWTSHFAPAARLVLATDVNESTLVEARKKSYPPGRVTFQVADAYALRTDTASVPASSASYDAAFAGDWWSHIPKSRVGDFLTGLAGRLAPGARVAFLDQLPNERSYREGSCHDAEGNHIQQRDLPGAGRFAVIKNFPTETELRAAVAPIAEPDSVEYLNYPECRRWLLGFTLL